MKVNLERVWDEVRSDGDWLGVRQKVSGLMPMPGSPSFDDDEKFLGLQIFPGVLVSDDRWPFPREWVPNSELTRAPLLYVDFNVDLGSGGSLLDSENRNLKLTSKRFMYLLIFRPNQRPLSVASYRIYRQAFFRVLHWTYTTGKERGARSVADLSDYRLLAECIDTLDKVQRRTLTQIYELLRWWRAKAPSAYGLFVPPPSQGAIEEHSVFDPTNIRDDSEPIEDKTWRPLPDSFVAAEGRICLDYAEKLLPVILEVLPSLRELRPVKGVRPKKEVRAILSEVEWPKLSCKYNVPRNLMELSFLLATCQLAVIQLLSLMIGARWSEIKAMPIGCTTRKRVNGEDIYVLDAKTFKLSLVVKGTDHQWPISTRLGQILEMHGKVARLVNGRRWRYLWYGCIKRLFDGNVLVIQVDRGLKAFVRRHDLSQYLDGSNFHHHRFRKTVARLVVIALNGGPMILRELFGHATLAMTMSYILSDRDLRDDLRKIAEEENRATAKSFIDEADALRGGGAEYFNEVLDRARSELSIYVPEGRRDQMAFTVQDLIDFMWSEPEGMQIKQVLPGVVGCFKPTFEAGDCSRQGQPPDVARCSRRCRWHLLIEDRGWDMAVVSVRDALEHLKSTKGTLARGFWKRIVDDWVSDFPELREEFADNVLFRSLVGT